MDKIKVSNGYYIYINTHTRIGVGLDPVSEFKTQKEPRKEKSINSQGIHHIKRIAIAIPSEHCKMP